MQGYYDIFTKDYFKSYSTEAHVFFLRRQQGAKFEHFDVYNVIYHKFLHGSISYMLNGENVNVMLEFVLWPTNQTLVYI